MSDSTNTAMSGREVSLARRRAMSQNGKASLPAKGAPAARAPQRAAAPAAPARAVATPSMSDDCENMVGGARAACIARRRAMSTNGKSAVKTNDVRRADLLAATSVSDARSAVSPAPVPAVAEKANVAAETAMDQVCEALPGDASFDTPAMSEARALCMARRQGMSSTGKTAIGKRATSASTRGGNGSVVAGNGRDIAKRRRAEMCSMGSDKTGKCRPTGRVRPGTDSEAPQKVETATTLSGQTVTGNNVERSQRVTGNEYGACRPITGTEYIGSDQYDKFCGTRPQPAPAKVGVSSTSRAQTVSGTEVGRSSKVTGDETGSCRNVTGTEYFSTERFDSFCGSRPKPAPAKVGAAYTRGDKVVTGTLVGRSEKVTGDEPGSNRSITGTSYYRTSNMEGASPKKVEVTHTGHGLPVSGTTVGSSKKVTGDEFGECKAVSGTEYISNEQFASYCGGNPIDNPRKVSVMKTLDGRPVTGTNVNRSIKVSGDEAGSCTKLTGSQYYAVSDFSDLCDRRSPSKVNQMSTLSERNLTGTQIGGSVKVTGDDHGNCKPVTGTEYLGREHFKSVCSAAPAPKPEKGGISRTWLGQSVSGTQVERSVLVTGDEYGACKPVTGTPYVGAGQYQDFCGVEQVNEGVARTFDERSTPGHSITGSQPGIKGKMTGDARGACLPLSGTPYVGDDQYSGACATPPATAMNRGAHPRTLSPKTGVASRISGNHVEEVSKREVPTRDFSVLSPARDAWLRRDTRVTGTAYAGDGRVTGPIVKAPGMVSGTPEFRYTDDAVVVGQPVEAPVDEAGEERSRVTGEGLNTKRITGDDWERGSRVTGTEGNSASRRNPTQRGGAQSGHIQAGANNFRAIERPEVPASRITGSSGNAASGPAITLSGGARG